jgi:hypothetical protein
VILWSELLARENRYREISRQCPNSADPRGTIIHPAETIDSEPPASAEGVLTPLGAMGLQRWLEM